MHVCAPAWTVFDSDVVVVRDVQLLSGQAFVSLPDLEPLTVGTKVRSKVDTEIGIGEVVGCETDVGATGLVGPLLQGEIIGSVGEAFEAARI